MPNKKIPAFTLAEMMVTLALTSIMITFCYMSFNYIQKLLVQFREQSFFVTQLNELNRRGNILMGLPGTVTKESDDKVIFKNDSLAGSFDFKNKYILLSRFGRADTFFMKPENISYHYEPMRSTLWHDRLVNAVELDIYFQKQKFHLTFHKNYDALTRLELEKEDNGIH